MSAQRGQWNSKLGFIMAAAGSAVGLGNIWRFPYVTGENGGAAFLLVYIAFVFLVGLPYMYVELALGRATQKNPVGAIDAIRPKSLWRLAGFLGVITGVGILSFYSVIAGWTVAYIYKMIVNSPGGFTEMIANPMEEFILFAIFLSLTAVIVYKGVSEGIEKWSKILMPVFLLMLAGLIVYAVTLKGAGRGLEFYLKPDFTKINGSVILSALGQSFFSLSLGMGTMITYGSYIGKKDNILTSGLSVAGFDTLVAFMAGLIIFPALFAMGKSPEAGPTLVFVILPDLFTHMPGGLIVGAIFFILLSVAALTSTISLLEVPVAYIIDEFKFERKYVAWVVAAISFIVGIPSAVSQGYSDFFTNFGIIPDFLAGPDFLSQINFIFGEMALAIGAMLTCIFVGWVWGVKNASAEIESSTPGFAKWKGLWGVMIKYIIPVVVFLVLLSVFNVF